MNHFAVALALMFMGVLLYVGIILFIFFLRRHGWFPGGRPSFRGLGNAFLRLQHIVQPEKQYVLEQTEVEKREEDEEGGPDDPTGR